MKTSFKILLSIPTFIQFMYFLSYIFPQNFHWLIQIEDIYYLAQINNIILIITAVILTKRIWDHGNISKDTKWLWTLSLFMVSFITIPAYLWWMEDKFIEENIS